MRLSRRLACTEKEKLLYIGLLIHWMQTKARNLIMILGYD